MKPEFQESIVSNMRSIVVTDLNISKALHQKLNQLLSSEEHNLPKSKSYMQ